MNLTWPRQKLLIRRRQATKVMRILETRTFILFKEWLSKFSMSYARSENLFYAYSKKYFYHKSSQRYWFRKNRTNRKKDWFGWLLGIPVLDRNLFIFIINHIVFYIRVPSIVLFAINILYTAIGRLEFPQNPKIPQWLITIYRNLFNFIINQWIRFNIYLSLCITLERIFMPDGKFQWEWLFTESTTQIISNILA